MLARSFATGRMPTERTTVERRRLDERLLVEGALVGDVDSRTSLGLRLASESLLDEGLAPFVRAASIAR